MIKVLNFYLFIFRMVCFILWIFFLILKWDLSSSNWLFDDTPVAADLFKHVVFLFATNSTSEIWMSTIKDFSKDGKNKVFAFFDASPSSRPKERLANTRNSPEGSDLNAAYEKEILNNLGSLEHANVIVRALDYSSSGAIQKTFQEVFEQEGHIDTAVFHTYNGDLMEPGMGCFEFLEDDIIEQQFQSAVLKPIRLAKSLLPYLRMAHNHK